MGNILKECDGILNHNVYKINNLKVYQYGNVIKLLYFKKPTRAKGFECKKEKIPEVIPQAESIEQLIEWFEKANAKKAEKLKANVRRAKNKDYELAMCNEWEYFATFTIKGDKWSRGQLHEFYGKFSKWLNNYNCRKKCNVKYVISPELHKDKKNWHFHGLIKGIPEDELKKFVKGMHPEKLVNSDYLNWGSYEKKFGFCSFGKIKDPERVAVYITKYVTKQITETKIEVGKHLYYASKGLKGRELIYDDEFYPKEGQEWDFENDFVCIKTLKEGETL